LSNDKHIFFFCKDRFHIAIQYFGAFLFFMFSGIGQLSIISDFRFLFDMNIHLGHCKFYKLLINHPAIFFVDDVRSYRSNFIQYEVAASQHAQTLTPNFFGFFGIYCIKLTQHLVPIICSSILRLQPGWKISKNDLLSLSSNPPSLKRFV